MSDRIQPQCLPIPNDRPSIQSMVREQLMRHTDDDVAGALVCADLQRREAHGIEVYGTALQAWNGRDALRDAYEECLDKACYLKQAIKEGYIVLADMLDQELRDACRLRRIMSIRDSARSIGDVLDGEAA